MENDVLGLRELESFKKDLKLSPPGMMTTRCCGTGTCEDQPIPTYRTIHENSNSLIVPKAFDSKSSAEITEKIGYLRL